MIRVGTQSQIRMHVEEDDQVDEEEVDVSRCNRIVGTWKFYIYERLRSLYQEGHGQ